MYMQNKYSVLTPFALYSLLSAAKLQSLLRRRLKNVYLAQELKSNNYCLIRLYRFYSLTSSDHICTMPYMYNKGIEK